MRKESGDGKYIEIDALESRPVRTKEGNWTTIVSKVKKKIPNLGRGYLGCNICGFEGYPKCMEWCQLDYK